MDVSSRATSHAGALALLNRAFGSTQGCLALRARVQISSSALSVSRPRLFFWQDWKNQNFNRKPQDKKIKVFTPNMYEESSFDLFLSLFESQREKESPLFGPSLVFRWQSVLRWSDQCLLAFAIFFFFFKSYEISMLLTQAICSKSVSVERSCQRSCLHWLRLHMLIWECFTLERGYKQTWFVAACFWEP